MRLNQQIAQDLADIKDALLHTKRVLNFIETAQYTGFSESYLYKLTSAGIIPFSKPNGKTLFFDRQKLDEWLLSNRSISSTERDIQAATFISTNPK